LYLRDHPDFAATLSEITVVPLAAAVDARRGALAYALGQAMQAIRADGALDRILQTHLGAAPVAPPR
jgi:hypothetical protein